MSVNEMDEYWVPEHVRDYLRRMGFVLPLDDMEPWIRSWDDWLSARGDFYDYRDKDGMGRVYEVHRRSIHPAMRVCKEWGSLLLNENVKVVSENQAVTDWLEAFFSTTNFMSAAQATVVRAFGLGTGAWALWVDLDKRKVRIRHYDARMVIPLTWDEDGITECAFVTRAFYRGKAVDQLQMHLRGGLERDGLVTDDSGTYRIVTVFFDRAGNEIEPVGIVPLYDTGCSCPTFGVVRPAVTNTRVDMSPYGQSVFADAVDAIQAVDLTFDALINEISVRQEKTGVALALPLDVRAGEAIARYVLGARRDCDGREVFTTTMGAARPLLTTSINYIVCKYSPAADAAGFVGVHGPHAFRRGLGAAMVNSGASLPEAAEVLGHSRAESAMPYASMATERLRSCPVGLGELPHEGKGADDGRLR